ncbi:hypothetical protein WJX81_000364 [Elliptochloris bilobata]|uniref:Uncharacterized protein n=1 Tax=Elliptochloris bilobata TaxID=381761 RepID=A0AAW1QU46_9CHLO
MASRWSAIIKVVTKRVLEVAQCSVCGAEGQHVAWAGVEFVDLIDVPTLSCPLCNKSFAAHPLQAGCFPSTPVESFHVAIAQEYGFMLAYLREVTTGVPGYPKQPLA